MLFVCFWPINRHVFVFERPSTLNYIPTLWGSKRWYLRERTQSKILRGWKTRFFLREGSGDEENIHILLWYLEKWCVCIYKYHETPFSMKSKIFGHLKPRLLTIKTSKKCRFGGPMLYIYIPGTQMTLVLLGKGLVLEGSTPKIENKQVLGIYILI